MCAQKNVWINHGHKRVESDLCDQCWQDLAKNRSPEIAEIKGLVEKAKQSLPT